MCMCAISDTAAGEEACQGWNDQDGMHAPSRHGVYSLLHKCCQTMDVEGGRHAHSLMVLCGFEHVGILCDHLLRLFACNGTLFEANLVFNKVSEPCAHTWHALISAHSSFGQSKEAIVLYHRMLYEGFQPDKFILSCVSKACGIVGDFLNGRVVHDEIIRSGLEEEKVLQATLLDMYAKLGSLDSALGMFDANREQDQVVWGTVISGYAQNGLDDLAMEYFKQMLAKGLQPDKVTFICILKACGHPPAFKQGLHIHAHIIVAGFERDVIVCNTLIDMYAKCGSWEDARKVFDNLPDRDIVSWGALMTGYGQRETDPKSIQLFENMLNEGLKPDKVAFACALKACTKTGAIGDGRCIYDMLIRSRLESHVVVGNSLIDLFAKCGYLDEAQKVFEMLHVRNVVSWNALLAGYVHHGNGLLVLELFQEMQRKSMAPDKVTYVCVLRACNLTETRGLEYMIHDKFIRSGIHFDTILGNTLIDVYAKRGKLVDAYKVFQYTPARDAVSWSALIAGYAQHGHGHQAFELIDTMKYQGIKPDPPMFLCVLKACTHNLCLREGRMVHQLVIVESFERDISIGNALVDMYAKCGSLNEAESMFESLPVRDKVSWSVIIAGYCQHGLGSVALQFFHRMQGEDLIVDKITLTSILKACALTESLHQGMIIHDQIVRSGLGSDLIVGNALVDLYAKCGSLEQAYKVFENLPKRDTITWGAMVTGYAQHGENMHALQFFEEMQKLGVKADEITFSSVLKACSGSGTSEQGKLLHDLVIRNGYTVDILITNTLIDMYGKFGFLDEARRIFDRMSYHDIVSWNAMIVSYVQHGYGFSAIELFDKMQEQGTSPDNITYISTLKACSTVGATNHGRLIHDQIIRSGEDRDLTVGNTLVDMYASCGNLNEACKSFERLSCRNAISWNAMISGYSQLGSFKMLKECLQGMQKDGLKPDGWSFTSILAACSHEGLVDEGHAYFKSIREEHGITPSMEHFNCMIELLGSTGRLQEAERLLQSMPIVPDVTGWMTLLGACKTYGDTGLGKLCFDQAYLLDPNHAAGYVIMSNIFRDSYEGMNDVEQLHQSSEGFDWADKYEENVEQALMPY